MANKIVGFTDTDGNALYPKIAQTVNVPSSGTTQTFTLTSGKTYLLFVTRMNTTDTGGQGMYLIQAHSSNSCVRAIAESSAATVAVNALTLTVTTANANVHLALMPIYI